MSYMSLFFKVWLFSIGMVFLVWLISAKMGVGWLRRTVSVVSVVIFLTPYLGMLPYPPLPYYHYIWNVAPLYLTPLDKYSIQGSVLDAKTNKPISDAIVVGVWGTMQSGKMHCFHTQDATTNINGNYSMVPSNDVPALIRDRLRDATLWIFVHKIGYRMTGLSPPVNAELAQSIPFLNGGDAHLEADRKSPQQRLKYLMDMSETAYCYWNGVENKNLIRFHDSLYQEAKSLGGDKKIVSGLCWRIANLAVRATEKNIAWNDLTRLEQQYQKNNYPECLEISTKSSPGDIGSVSQ